MFSGNTARRLEESGGVTVRPWVGQQQRMTLAGHEPHRLASEAGLEHFPSKWNPVGRKKVLKANDLERRSDSIGSTSALAAPRLPARLQNQLKKSTQII